jgi:hypothetical protein
MYNTVAPGWGLVVGLATRYTEVSLLQNAKRIEKGARDSSPEGRIMKET